MRGAMAVTVDRAEIVHFAGRHRLSPALRDGRPALVGAGEPGERCGWEAFFRALEASALAASLDPEAGAVSFLPRGAVARGGGDRAGGAFARARRFLAAWRGRYRPG